MEKLNSFDCKFFDHGMTYTECGWEPVEPASCSKITDANGQPTRALGVGTRDGLPCGACSSFLSRDDEIPF